MGCVLSSESSESSFEGTIGLSFLFLDGSVFLGVSFFFGIPCFLEMLRGTWLAEATFLTLYDKGKLDSVVEDGAEILSGLMGVVAICKF